MGKLWLNTEQITAYQWFLSSDKLVRRVVRFTVAKESGATANLMTTMTSPRSWAKKTKHAGARVVIYSLLPALKCTRASFIFHILSSLHSALFIDALNHFALSIATHNPISFLFLSKKNRNMTNSRFIYAGCKYPMDTKTWSKTNTALKTTKTIFWFWKTIHQNMECRAWNNETA